MKGRERGLEFLKGRQLGGSFNTPTLSTTWNLPRLPTLCSVCWWVRRISTHLDPTNPNAAGSRTQVVLSYPQKLYQLSPSDREVQMQRASKELKVEGNCKLHMEVVQDFIQNATNGSHG
ncbi:hypothetical protein LguiB_030890 [Lonicera macranthoides]